MRKKAWVGERWHQSLSHCERHRAEIRTFPLGIQAGYPPALDFSKIQERILADDMIKNLLNLVDNPEFFRASPAFKECEAEIKEAGYRKWASTKDPLRMIPG
jgi:hypothetical protein